jgi:EAL and modified HD-GYP domain-containing signal transduction protein
MEKGKWEQVSNFAAELQIDEQSLATKYLDAVKWAQDIYTL